MIISKQHKFVFVHNPKVGGTSIRKSIEHLHDYNVEFWHQSFDDRHERIQDRAHIPYDDLTEEVKDIMHHSFTFGFVRNPLDRFYSSYAEFKRQHSDWYPATLEINEFIRLMLTPANVRYDWRFIHFCPQHYFFYSGKTRVVKYVGNHSNFNHDWEEAKTLGKFLANPLSNSRRREEALKPELNDESLATLQHLYSKDISVFGFTNIIDDVSAVTHESRVLQIHNPYVLQSSTLGDSLTDGERIAYNQVQEKRKNSK